MRLDEFIDEFEVDIAAKKRQLAKEQSYEILDYVDQIDARIDPVRDSTHVGRASPEIFVGRTGYPSVSTGILTPTDPDADPTTHTTSSEWYHRDLSIGSIMQYRVGLLNSNRTSNVDVTDTWDGFVGTQREVAIADHPVDIELDLAATPEVDLNIDDVSAPTGPRAQTTDARLTENPHIPRPVKKTLEDDDWKAEGAINYLYNRDFDVYEINSILAAGALGRSENRRLVPTRWSITAVDDIIGQYLHGQIQTNDTIDKPLVFENTYIGNRYWIVLAPGKWEYELLEMKSPGSVWNPNTDEDIWVLSANEGFQGRTEYVDETSGAYYAARLGVLEYLHDIGRQAKVLVLRESSDEYWAPVGVWQIRESVRNAFENEPGRAQTFHDAIEQLVPLLPIDRETLRRKSTLSVGIQTRISNY